MKSTNYNPFEQLFIGIIIDKRRVEGKNVIQYLQSHKHSPREGSPLVRSSKPKPPAANYEKEVSEGIRIEEKKTTAGRHFYAGKFA